MAKSQKTFSLHSLPINFNKKWDCHRWKFSDIGELHNQPKN